jgi:hypothetical protein
MIRITLAMLFLAGLEIGAVNQGKNWRAIVPFHSTRTDVERLLGPPSAPPKDGTILYTPNPDIPLYFLEDEDVRIAYMTDRLAQRMSCSAVAVDTVTCVSVEYFRGSRRQLMLDEMGIDETKFETFDPSTPPNLGFKAYVNMEDGIYICTLNGRINKLVYFGNKTDRQACPGLTGDPKQFCNILVDLYNRQDKTDKSKGR